MKRKKTSKKVGSSSISKNEYLCMSPRTNNTARLTSEEKKIKIKNKSTQKLPGSTTLRKSKGDLNPKSPRKMFPY